MAAIFRMNSLPLQLLGHLSRLVKILGFLFWGPLNGAAIEAVGSVGCAMFWVHDFNPSNDPSELELLWKLVYTRNDSGVLLHIFPEVDRNIYA